MTLSEILARDCVAIDVKVTSKKQLIQEMAGIIENCGCIVEAQIDGKEIVNAALERERLGSTGVGSGVALPHARIEGLTSIKVALARLDTPIDFEAIDDRPVDIAVLILAPPDSGSDHLRALAQISRRLRDEDVRGRIRKAPDADSLYVIFTDQAQASAA